MLTYALDWVNLLLRWTHVIVAIAWAGASFYFVWLDNHLTPPTDPKLKEQGVSGELWAVHGGGFYNPQKYLGAPKALPKHLHWFYWESYSTWLTGFALFTVMYLFNAGTFLIDKSRFDWSPVAAAHAALGFSVGFWLIYDVLCRTVGRRPGSERLLGALVASVIVGAGSGWPASCLPVVPAFLLVGRDGGHGHERQRVLLDHSRASARWWRPCRPVQPVDPVHGQRGKQRSVHNTYFTLPVLFAMLSNHYGWAYSHAAQLAGAGADHAGRGADPPVLCGAPRDRDGGATCALGLGHRQCGRLAGRGRVAGAGTGPATPVAALSETPAQRLALVQNVIEQRCLMCHNAQLASKGVDSTALRRSTNTRKTFTSRRWCSRPCP